MAGYIRSGPEAFDPKIWEEAERGEVKPRQWPTYETVVERVSEQRDAVKLRPSTKLLVDAGTKGLPTRVYERAVRRERGSLSERFIIWWVSRAPGNRGYYK